MNVFYFSTAPLLAVLALVAIVFAVSYALSRHAGLQTRLMSSGLMSLATLFCIEVITVTDGLIPPQDYVLGQASGTGSNVLNDWVSSAAVNMGDLYMAWILVLACVVAAYYVKRSESSQKPSSRPHFYDHFGPSAAVSVVFTSVFYIYFVIPGYFDSNIVLLDKILFRGIIPYITVGLFVWVIMNIALLARQVIFQRQQDLYIENGFENAVENNDKQATLDSASHRSSLKCRLEELGKITGDTPLDLSEYTQIIDQQAELEREEVTVSILYLHTAMWAIPVLGFLGTVWGIAEAVANLTP
ncbi:MAG: MotA/TolQ/ExbB proton channel family protein, partial [Algicola sp.]|nr:MotA/TolQ/ExbB proton channel family protein [Algicola sp.]